MKNDNMEYAREVLRALRQAIAEFAQQEPALAFSGGIDSSIIALLLGEKGNPNLYTVGMAGSYDLRIGDKTADLLGLPWKGFVVDEHDLIEAIADICSMISTRNPVTISFELPLYLIASRVEERHIFTGQGADELFVGYARYRDTEQGELEMILKHDLTRLLHQGLEHEIRIASSFSKEVYHPFLHQKVIEEVASIPVSEEFRGDENKAVLRDVARLLNLGEISNRKKKAAQYGSGIMKALRKAAKERGMSVSSFIEMLADRG